MKMKEITKLEIFQVGVSAMVFRSRIRTEPPLKIRMLMSQTRPRLFKGEILIFLGIFPITIHDIPIHNDFDLCFVTSTGTFVFTSISIQDLIKENLLKRIENEDANLQGDKNLLFF